MIMEMKRTKTKELCDGLPREFTIFLDHIRSVEFGHKPKYAYLRKTFRNLFLREGFKYDNVFDWTIVRYLMMHPSEELEGEEEDTVLTTVTPTS